MADKQKAQPRPWRLGPATDLYISGRIVDSQGDGILGSVPNKRLVIQCVNGVSRDEAGLAGICIAFLEDLGYNVERD